MNILNLHTHKKLNASSNNQHPTIYIEDDITPDVLSTPNLNLNSTSSTSPVDPQQNLATSTHNTLAPNHGRISVDSGDTVPDMDAVLLKFGIAYNNLIEIPLRHYRWWSFGLDDIDGETTTIAQRIGSMVRSTRRCPYSTKTNTE